MWSGGFCYQGTRDQIAVRVTHTPRPQTQLIGEMPTDKVMKRCYSSYQTYVILSLKRSTQHPSCHWMDQDWVVPLQQWGEFKVYIVNMVMVYIAVVQWNKALGVCVTGKNSTTQ